MLISAADIHKIDQLSDFEERVHAAAKLYARNGIYVIPVMPNDKSLPYPVKKYNINYSHASRTQKTIDKWFGEGGLFRGFNLGIACGREGGVFAVDVDVEDKHGNRGYDNLAKLEAEHGALDAPIQETPTGGRHYLYQWTDYAKSSSGKLAKAIDTRGGDADQCKSHIVAYPSVRPEGEYRWTGYGDVPELPKWITGSMGIPWGGNTSRGNDEVDEDDLETKYTPRQIWKMLECIEIDDLEYDEWLYCLQAIHSQHPDEIGFQMADEFSKRGARYEPNEVALRWKSFDECGEIRIGSLIHFAQKGGFNPRTEPKGADEASEEVEDIVAEYNEKFGIVMVGNKLRVLMEQFNPDPFQENFKLMTPMDFKGLRASDVTYMADKKGNPKAVPKAELWYSDPERREFVNGLTFRPDAEREVDGCFNVWEGWRYEEKAGDWSLFKKHIRNMVGTEEEYEWLLDWMADALQDPTNPKGCAVVMKGIEGTGKGTIANVFGELFGQHYKHIIQEDQLIGKFNGHMEEALLVFADEVTYGGNKKVAGTLKGLVTEKRLMIERKGLDATAYRNCMRLMIASNEDWFIPAGPHSRRWYVIDIPSDFASSKEYFDAIYSQMEAGGYDGMFHELRNREIHSDLRKAPVTKLLLEQRARYTTTDSIVEWWADKVDSGVLGIVGYEELGEEPDWGELAERAGFYDDYNEWCKSSGARRQAKPAFYSKLERDFGLVKCRPTNPHGGTRKQMYEVPSIHDCAKLVESVAGIQIDTGDTV
ncbi:DNA primase [Vibrio phage K296]